MRHHTKDKGDTGLGFVLSSLMSNGISVALPLSEHLPFDCIAIGPQGDLRKVSVKYRSSASSGSVKVQLRSTWADRHGSHTKKHEKGSYDVIAIYCPETTLCYFVRMDEITGEEITLRVEALHSRKPEKYFHLATNYTDPLRLFAPVVQ